MGELPFSEHLRAELGSPTAVVRLDSSPRSRVWRVELAGTPAVVKQLVPGPEATDRHTREVTALRLASRATPPVTPALLGTDPEQRERLRTLPTTALLHGDPCPGNDMHTPQGVRFIDFEQASLGNGLVELAYLRIGFPTCWCATAPTPLLLQAAETAYRTTWQSITGTDLLSTTTDACTGWLIQGDALVPRAQRGTVDHLTEATTRDWHWGTATARQRLTHRLAVVSELTADDSALAGISLLTSAMHASALAHWPTLEPLPTRRP